MMMVGRHVVLTPPRPENDDFKDGGFLPIKLMNVS